MTLIADTNQLNTLVKRLKQAPFVTVDTEFMRDSSYYSRLCLIQIADQDDAWAIDPLADGMDLAPFYDLMNNSDVLKVFHACRQDLEIFFQATGELPKPIFDTQVAAMVCGFGEAAGYETLVNQIAGQKLDKSARFTDWARRPLTDRQLQYALGDVTHLRVIYRTLSEQLDKTGRTPWVAEEMNILTSTDTYRLEPEDAWKRIKIRSATPRFLARLRALAHWREELAQARDVPRNRIVKDDVILEICSQPPRTPQALDHIRGLSKGFHASSAGRSLWASLEEAEALPDSDLPVPERAPRSKQKTPPVTDLLKVLLKSRCQDVGVAPKLVASSADIEAIARDDKATVPALKGWRYDLFGRDALDIKHGRLAMTASGPNIEIVEIENS